jgi:ribonuclease HI
VTPRRPSPRPARRAKHAPRRVTVYIDGGSRGNPGPAAAGVVVLDTHGTVLHEAGIYLGQATNNVAEYRGLLAGLEAAAASGATELEIVSDSELLVRQMTGEYRVKNPGLVPLAERARRLANGFAACTFRHVRREDNLRADRLVNQALDAQANVGERG